MFLKSPPTGGAPPPTNERNKPNPLPSCLLPPAFCLLPCFLKVMSKINAILVV
ncbi:MAG: hypothetical protein F6K41_40745 [Symploca sp. SIO3E6]|nr:hypothetical protein [Caldora sp. SIO3E6]